MLYYYNNKSAIIFKRTVFKRIDAVEILWIFCAKRFLTDVLIFFSRRAWEPAGVTRKGQSHSFEFFLPHFSNNNAFAAFPLKFNKFMIISLCLFFLFIQIFLNKAIYFDSELLNEEKKRSMWSTMSAVVYYTVAGTGRPSAKRSKMHIQHTAIIYKIILFLFPRLQWVFALKNLIDC